MLAKILLVDDELDIINSLKMGLQKEGFEVYVYNDPQKALEEFKANFYDLIILDIRMPKLNGFQLYRELTILDGKAKFFFLTAYENYRQEFNKAFPELNETRFLKKPMGTRELLQQIQELEPDVVNQN